MEIKKGIFTLVSGTASAQLITILLAPILSRYYSPESFGGWAIYVAIASFLIIISSLRFDRSILLPSDEEHALQLIKLSIIIGLLFSILTLLFVVAFDSLYSDIKRIYWMLALSVFVGGVTQVVVSYANREDKYGAIAASKLVQSIATGAVNVFTIIFIVDGLNETHLIVATLIGQFLALIIICWKVDFGALVFDKLMNTSLSVKLAASYKDFPLFSVPEAALSSLLAQFPIYALGFLYSADMVGQFSMAQRVLLLPISIVGGAVAQVYTPRFAKMVNQGEPIVGKLHVLWLACILVAVVPALILYFWGEAIFLLVFGAKWGEAGAIASSLALPLLIVFSASVSSGLHMVLRLQHYSLLFSLLMIFGKGLVFLKGSSSPIELVVNLVLVDVLAVVLMNVLAYSKALRIGK